LAFYYLACIDEIDNEVRSLRSVMVGSEESARRLEREIANLNRTRQELQAEIEELCGKASNKPRETSGNAASAIRAFGQLTLQRNSEKSTKSARARRVE
jgi:predicted  nucleic acid-binding Zn-ribbon protein